MNGLRKIICKGIGRGDSWRDAEGYESKGNLNCHSEQVFFAAARNLAGRAQGRAFGPHP
jgi:hypothetical protein